MYWGLCSSCCLERRFRLLLRFSRREDLRFSSSTPFSTASDPIAVLNLKQGRVPVQVNGSWMRRAGASSPDRRCCQCDQCMPMWRFAYFAILPILILAKLPKLPKLPKPNCSSLFSSVLLIKSKGSKMASLM